MTENPYQAPSGEQLETERTVIVDPSGATITIGARIERITTDDAGNERRDVLNAVTASADHAELLFPYANPLWRCAVCGAQPLAKPFFCAVCRRPVDAACVIFQDEVVLCRDCGHVPWWLRCYRWLLDL